MRCLQCGQEIQSKTAKKFCCSSCAATYNNQHRAHTTKGRTKLHICIKCGNQFEGSVHLTGIRRICHKCGGGGKELPRLTDKMFAKITQDVIERRHANK